MLLFSPTSGYSVPVSLFSFAVGIRSGEQSESSVSSVSIGVGAEICSISGIHDIKFSLSRTHMHPYIYTSCAY